MRDTAKLYGVCKIIFRLFYFQYSLISYRFCFTCSRGSGLWNNWNFYLWYAYKSLYMGGFFKEGYGFYSVRYTTDRENWFFVGEHVCRTSMTMPFGFTYMTVYLRSPAQLPFFTYRIIDQHFSDIVIYRLFSNIITV